MRQLYPRDVDTSSTVSADVLITVPVLLDRRGRAGSAPAPEAARHRSAGGGGSGGSGASFGLAAWLRVFDDGPDHGQQRDAVLGDDGQKRMLFTGRQRGKRTHRAPHLLTLAWGIAAARRASCGQSHRRVEPVEDGLSQQPQFGTDLGVRPSHAGHTSGFGRNRTVSSLPFSWASTTMHRRRTDASRTRRRMPPAPMIKSSSTRPNVKAAESTCGNSSRIR